MRPTWLMLGAFASVGLVACGGDRNDDRGVETTTSDGTLEAPAASGRNASFVRMINALPTGGAATVTADDRPVFDGVDFKAVTPYEEVRETFTRFRLQGGGRDTTIAGNNEILIDGSRYTMVALPEGDGGVRLRVLKDDFRVDDNRARLRVIHGVAGVENIDVLLQGDNEPLFDNVGLATEAGFEDVEPRNTTMIVRADGSGRQLLRKELRLEAGHSYTVVLTGGNRQGGAAQRIEAIVIDDRPMRTTDGRDSVAIQGAVR
jgi:hypothetical protein